MYEQNCYRGTDERVLRPHEFLESNLITLSKKDDPDEILLHIGNSKSGFVEFIRKQINPKFVYYIVRLLRKVCDAKKQDVSRREILKEIETNFLHQLNEFLNLVCLKDPKTFPVWDSKRLGKFLRNTSKLLSAVITTLPSSVGKCKGVITAVKGVIEVHGVEGLDESVRDVEEILKRETQAKQSWRTEEGQKSRCKFASGTEHIQVEDKDPPDDFRSISVFPTLNDLHEDVKPFLRPNKVFGKYDNLDHYLDVQFRLLREDYIQPLRKGIADYRHFIKEGIVVTKLKDIRLYQSVQLLYPVCFGGGISYVLQFDIKKLSRVNWGFSRRLLYGSLVCLSKDNFKTIIYATITDRNTTELAQGNIQVYFENKSDLLSIQPDTSFVMAETTAYFEAYRYILEGLKEMDERMPLQRYVIACETDVQPPMYLQRNEPVLYNFSCLFHKKVKLSLPSSSPTDLYNLLGLSRKEKEPRLIPILQTENWEPATDLNLDSSQYEALQQAITKELAIIQGPPGTGKTFVGLKIVQLLLNNIDRWTEPQQKYPILVVCYTNHALDQFLQGVLQFSNRKLVRIGGRCKNKTLQPFILRNIKQNRNITPSKDEIDRSSELENSKIEIADISSKIKQTSTNVIHYEFLQEFMSDSQRKMFEPTEDDCFQMNCLSKWIGIFEEDDDSSTNETTLAQKFQNVWEQTILLTVHELSKNKRDSLINPWDLETGRRAELYKTWVSELIENVQSHLFKIQKESKRSDKRKLQLERLIQKTRESILGIETLLKHVTNYRSRKEIQSLFAGRCVVVNKLTMYWLDLLGRKQSIPHIKQAFEDLFLTDKKENQDGELSDDKEDLTGDRQLDENDDILFYHNSRKREDKLKTKNDDNTWILNVSAKLTAYKIKILLNSARKLNQEEADSMINVWDLDNSKRRDLYAHWVFQYRQKLKDQVKLYEEVFNNAMEKLEEIHNLQTTDILKEAEVIGMTTTGAAKYRRLLNTVTPKIIIVEEAAEVLESHIITTLNENCQHLILIGDHKQLRPSTTVYALSKNYKLDVSLFERMIQNKVPFVTLQEQHRMRPDISCLLRNERLYPTLKDHDSVLRYESIMGVDMNVQFIDHEEPELVPEDSTSYCNPHEAQYIAELCRYFLNQGYSPLQITVITPYMAQVQLLRRAMPTSSFEGVRITAVDNYQGEENDIILLSLVRSSCSSSQRRNNIGFVGIENRICVSLSRAKKGLYVLGNFKLLELNSQLWHDIVQLMKGKGAIKSELTLRCRNHPEKFVLAREPKDFEKFPLGGCGQSCGAELPCGHICPRNCHHFDKSHANVTCERRCEKTCDQGHKCTEICGKACGDCFTIVEKIIPFCGHTAQMECYEDPKVWECTETCSFTLQCGHICSRKCYDCRKSHRHETMCKKNVEKVLPCLHIVKMNCSTSVEAFECRETCSAILDCNHKCKAKCSTCFRDRIHGQCSGTCKKILPCGHVCSKPCSQMCPPCNKCCNWKCSHGRPCQNKCWQKCNKCTDDCLFRCSHQRCEQKCYEICSIGPCQKRCSRKLNCRHICRGLCGERCICSICSKNLIRRNLREKFDETTVFIQLPDCLCIFEIHQLDKHMDTPLISEQGSLSKICPHCSKPITAHIRRYTNILKQTRANIVQKFKSITGTNIERRQLNEEIFNLGRLGLTQIEIKTLQRAIENVSMGGSLNTIKQSVDRLKKLLEITSGMHNCQTKSIEDGPVILRNMLVNVRTFPTCQFWTEVDAEIKRYTLELRLLTVQKNLSKNYTELQEMVGLALKVLSEKVIINENREECLKEVDGMVQTFLDTSCIDNHDKDLVKKLTLKLKAQRTLSDLIEITGECTRLETDTLSTKNSGPLNIPYGRTRNMADVLLTKNKHGDGNIFRTRSKTRNNGETARINQTPLCDITFGSIDSIELYTRRPLHVVVEGDILLSSDSIDLSIVISRLRNTQGQETTPETLPNAEETYDKHSKTIQ